ERTAEVDKVRARLPEGAGLYVRVGDAFPLPDTGVPTVWVARTPAQLDAWFGAPWPDSVEEIEVQLTAGTAAWMLAHRDLVEGALASLRIHQPSHEHMKDASDSDVRDPH